jgi:hypothetical protein
MKAVEHESLTDQADHVEQEARMILPGVQALFGFQLIAVFNSEFWARLSYREQLLHWFSLGLVAIAAMLILAPAAYHRQVEVDRVTEEFIHFATRAIFWGLFPLMTAICLDFYLIGRLITRNPTISAIAASALLSAFVGTWFVFPHIHQRWREAQNRSGSRKDPSH